MKITFFLLLAVFTVASLHGEVSSAWCQDGKPLANTPNMKSKNGLGEPLHLTQSSQSVTTGDAAATLKMLQGKWQALNDKSDFLVFENNHRKEIAGGETEWDDEIFVLSDKPMQEGREVSDHAPEKAGFIYCQKDDMCWAIVELTAKKLSLVYVGHGRVLEYRRVK